MSCNLVMGAYDVDKPLLEFLEWRQSLKEAARKRLRKEAHFAAAVGDSQGKNLHHDNYGSFFGPSEYTISSRVIEERRSIIATQRLFASKSSIAAARGVNKDHPSMLNNAVMKNSPNAASEWKLKARQLKESRDYACLLSDGDAEPPAPAKVSQSRSDAVTASDSRPMKKQKKETPVVEKPKIVLKTPMPSSKPQMKPPLKPMVPKDDAEPPAPATVLQSRNAAGPTSDSRPMKKQKKEPRAPEKPMSIPKTSMRSSHAQMRPPHQKPMAPRSPQEDRPKKKSGSRAAAADEAISIIREMFGYNPYSFEDDDDTSDMETNFADIQREERRSAKIAKEEDDRELCLIEEEERRQRARKLAKKRKLQRQH